MLINMVGLGIVVIGAQFGDEGKGKIVDFYASKQKIHSVVRFNGGANAGHTIIAENIKYALHLLPSGMVFEKPSFIGNGVVIDLEQLDKELNSLTEKKHKSLLGLLKISERAHLVLPLHKQLDVYQEEFKSKLSKEAGTTKRGIGPAYADKAYRFGIRFIDLWDEEHLTNALSLLNEYYEKNNSVSKTEFSIESLKQMLYSYREKFSQCLTDVGLDIENIILNGNNVLFEGAQATLLDLDHGLYPFGTSSICTASGASSGTGISVQYLNERIGVVKAYTSRVGSGPLIGELDYTNDPGKFIQVEGHEFGTTTGRPRRIAWLDLVAVRYACRVNGLTGLALTKLDILGMLQEFKVIVAYRNIESGETNLSSFPAQLSLFRKYEPVYKSFTGWGKKSTAEWKNIITKGYNELPLELINFIKFIEQETRTPVYILGLGPERDLTLEKREIFE